MKTFFNFMIFFCGMTFVSLILAILKFANIIFIDWWVVLLPVWGPIAFIFGMFILMFLLIYLLSALDNIEINKKK
jgi:hypothetical protein